MGAGLIIKQDLRGLTMFRERIQRYVINAGLSLALATAGGSAASATNLTILYGFNLNKAWSPRGDLLLDGSGNLYGAAYYGGKNVYPGYGAIYELSTSGAISYLYNFCKREGCTDGSNPTGPLIWDSNGNLYGTTYNGGNGGGVVFELTPQSGKTAWNETVLYAFAGGADGGGLNGGLVMDSLGNLYGIAQQGGANGSGEIFRVQPGGVKKVMYNFVAGDNPQAGLIIDGNGDIFGATYSGGQYGQGGVFELAANGVESELYSFCPNAGCSDGANPAAALTVDGQGNLYGTTVNGGNSAACGGAGCGAVFELSNGVETVLHAFDFQDGANPVGSLYLDDQGDIYGTTQAGGKKSLGAAFEIANGAESVLWNFGSERNDRDGVEPSSGFIADGQGNLYSVTATGGKKSLGVVFQLSQ